MNERLEAIMHLGDVFDIALTRDICFYGRGLFSRTCFDPNEKGWKELKPEQKATYPWKYEGLLAPGLTHEQAWGEATEAYGK